MGVPSDQLMKMMASQKDQATPGGIPPVPDASSAGAGLSDATTPPMASPMATPEPKMGNREAAMVNIGMAMDLLEQSLPAVGSESDEGRKILTAIRTMTDILGPRKAKSGELQQSEILQMLQTLPQAGGATPEGKAMSQAPAIPGMSQNVPPPSPVGGPTGGMPTPPPM